jgi:hypothetical protein
VAFQKESAPAKVQRKVRGVAFGPVADAELDEAAVRGANLGEEIEEDSVLAILGVNAEFMAVEIGKVVLVRKKAGIAVPGIGLREKRRLAVEGPQSKWKALNKLKVLDEGVGQSPFG